MTLTLTHSAPKQIVAGDTIDFLVAIPGDLDGWAGSARLTGASQMDASSVATEGSDYHVKFGGQTSPGTKTLTPGQYTLSVWATSGTDRYTVLQAQITITADLSTGTPALAHAVEVLGIIESAIKARLNGNTDGGLEEYEVDGTRVRKIAMADLQRLRNKYAAEVQRLQNPDAPYGRVKATFQPAGSPMNSMRRFG